MTATTSTAPQAFWQHLPVPLRESLRASVAKGLEALRVPEPVSLSVWAHRHFYLSAESSQRTQRWEAYPFQIGLMDAMSDDGIEEVDFQKSARLGYTKCLLAMMGYTAQHKRRNQAVWQPTDDDSDDFTKTEVEPMLRDVRIMRSVFPQVLAKSKVNTLQQKKFLGSVLKLRGGKSAGNFRRLTIAVAILDELDGFDQQVEKSGDPWTLAWKRLEGATYKKLIAGTTPRIKGFSHIEARCNAADVRMAYQVTCPHCEADHPLVWGGKESLHGMKWSHEDPENTVHHICPHCHGSIRQSDYLRIWRTGKWVSDCGNFQLVHGWSDNGEPWSQWQTAAGDKCIPPRHVAFHAWTAYSPQATWADIVREFLNASAKAKTGDKGPLQGFVNETLGETWEEEVDKADAHQLAKRAEAYSLRSVPLGGLQLAAGVDVQDDRFEIATWAFGRGEEMWLVDYTVLDANPADERDWKRLYDHLRLPLKHANGPHIGISAAAIDSGGHFTHQCYSFVHQYGNATQSLRLYAVKGSSKSGDPVKGRASSQDINHRGRVLKRGVKLWMVGTDTAKDLFFGRLKVTQPGAGYVHFSKDLATAFYNGLTAEVRMLAKTATGDQYRWVKRAARNEPLDCTVYAIFCAHMLDIHRHTERRWQQLEQAVAPDLFDLPVEPTVADGYQTRPADGQPPTPNPQRPANEAARINPASSTHNPFAPADWLARL